MELPLSSRYDIVMTMVDSVSKWAHFILTRMMVTAEGVARLFLHQVWKLHGLLKYVISDCGPQFIVSWLGKTAKSLSIFLFFFFSFILDLLHRGKCGKVSHHKCHIVRVTWQEVTASHHMTSYDESHDRHGKIVHRPCSSCISSVENLTGTLSSSPCQTLIKEQLV